MSRTVSLLAVVAVASTFGTGVADAQVRITDGGPRGAVGAEVQKALASAPLSVCWIEGRPERVEVGLVVGAQGAVERAEQKTAGAVGQCVAGILAVQRLPKTGRTYRMTVAVDTRGGGEELHAQLARHRGELEACWEQRGSKAAAPGVVTVKFLIKPDGRIGDAEVVRSAVGDKKAEACLVGRIQGLRLEPRPGGKAIAYSLDVGLGKAGVGASGGGGASSAGDGAPRPQKDGPVAADVIEAGVRPHLEAMGKCYRQRAKREARGYVMIRFTIRADGTVRNVKVRESTLGDARVEGCVVKVGETFRFPGAAGRAETRVFYPFVFAP